MDLRVWKGGRVKAERVTALRAAACVGGLLLLAWLSGCGPSAPRKPGVLAAGARKPNVVLVVIDTLRADRLGIHGYARRLTPNLDSLAAGGVAFERCIANAPWTLPSVASLFSSAYPPAHKAVYYLQMEAMDKDVAAKVSVFDESFVTIAETLKSAGYATAAVSANKFVRPEYGFGQGFDAFVHEFGGENHVNGASVNVPALEWLKTRPADKPFFLYVHYMDVHGPYDAEPRFMEPLLAQVEANPNKQPMPAIALQRMNAYLNKPPKHDSDASRHERLKQYHEYWVARYDAGVAQADHYVGELLAGLRAAGLWDDTYMIVTADHGEELFEHKFWDHGNSLYQTELRVPLILRWANVLPAGGRISINAELIDVLPTLSEQLGLPAPSGVQGQSLVDAIAGLPRTAPNEAFATGVKNAAPLSQWALLQDDWKLLAGQHGGGRRPDGTVVPPGVLSALVNLQVDPVEARKNVSAENPEVAKRLGQRLNALLKECAELKPGFTGGSRSLTPEQIRSLQALGYAGEVSAGDAASQPTDSSPASGPATRPASRPASRPTSAAAGSQPASQPASEDRP